VRWRTRGALLLGGEGYRRAAGEEDEMPLQLAKTLIAVGVVELVDAEVPTVAEVVGCEEDEG